MALDESSTPANAAQPEEFVRPGRFIFTRWINSWLPPQPPDQIKLDFGELTRKPGRRDYLAAVPMLFVYLALLVGQIKLWSGMAWSPFSVVLNALIWLVKSVGVSKSLAMTIFWWTEGTLVALLVVVGLVIVAIKILLKLTDKDMPATDSHEHVQPNEARTVESKKLLFWRKDRPSEKAGFLSLAAVVEEQWFREGAENWTRRQRLASCTGFALVHLLNLIYPLATLLPLALMGFVFMRVYLRTYRKTGNRQLAILRSSKLHRIYNRVALWGFCVQLMYYIGLSLHLYH